MARKKEPEKRRAILKMRSITQMNGQAAEPIDMFATAWYRYQPNRVEIGFTENFDNSTEDDNVMTLITVLNNSVVTIQKHGFVETTMVLETERTHSAHYQTMLGFFEMRVSALRIEPSFHENGGRLRLVYLIGTGERSDSPATNVVQMDVRVAEDQRAEDSAQSRTGREEEAPYE